MATSHLSLPVAAARSVKPPAGRLTLTSGTPVMTAEAAAQTTIYYTPYVGNHWPKYDGNLWTEQTFAELSIAMAGSANWASGSVFDLYLFDDSGTLRLVTGTAWTNTTTRAASLTRTNGIWLNTDSQTARYGASSTVTMPALRGVYVGTVYMSANGTTTWELGGTASGGDPVKWFLWNCYNRVDLSAWTGDTSTFWTYASSTVRAANASTSMQISYVAGLNEDAITAEYMMVLQVDGSGGPTDGAIGIGLDATNAYASGCRANYGYTDAGGISIFPGTTFYVDDCGLGYHYLQACESNTIGTVKYYGFSTPIQTGMGARWRA